MSGRIVLAYTGSLQTSMAIHALSEDAEVVTLTLDIGQGRDLQEVRDRALATGAVRAHVLDVREEFAREFVLPALRAGALRHGGYPMGQMLAWPLIARKLVDIATVEGASAVAHGCFDDDQQRISTCIAALDPVPVVAAGCRDVAQRAHENLWGRARAAIGTWVEAPHSATDLEITFEQGVPAAINGVPMPLIELIDSLSVIGGPHGVGWIEAARAEGEVGPGGDHAYEATAAVVLHAARAALDAALLPSDLLRLKQDRATAYARLVSEGRWFTEGRDAIDALNVRMEENVTGSVRIKLFKGTLHTSEVVCVGHAEVSLP